jgi:membrane-associated protease RseP (regulator of RpoE activity)
MKLDRRKVMIAGTTVCAGALAAGASAVGAAPAAKATSAPEAMPSSHTKSYLMPAPIDVVWRAWTDPAERKVWFGVAQEPLKGALEVRAPHYIKVGTDHPGLPGPTQQTATFETAPGGTIVTHTDTGYGTTPVWRNSFQSSIDGIDEMMTDLALYLRTGVGFPRHTGRAFPNRAPHPNDLRFGTRNIDGGLEIMEVSEGSLAAQVGLQPGDTVVAIGDAGVFSMRDLRMANLMHAPGDMIEVTWVRGKQIMKGSGRMATAPIKWRNGYNPTAAGK